MSGDIVKDHMWLAPAQHGAAPADLVLASVSKPSVPVAFGCDNIESGEIYRQAADGITGLSDAPLSVITQLAEAGAIEPEFTICFGQNGGVPCLQL